MIFFTKLKLTELKLTNKGSTSFQVNNENYFGKTTMPKYVTYATASNVDPDPHYGRPPGSGTACAH